MKLLLYLSQAESLLLEFVCCCELLRASFCYGGFWAQGIDWLLYLIR